MLPGESGISTCTIPMDTSCRLLVRYNDLERITFADEGSMAVTVEMQQTGDPSVQAARWGVPKESTLQFQVGCSVDDIDQ